LSHVEPRLTAYVVPHTHWDREWYQPFEVFRTRLVDVVDAALALLQAEGGRYRRFTLDGQAVVLDDYLAVRPDRFEAIAEQVRLGRLRIGPWYVLADEFLVSPESLVRNLQAGRIACARFGGAMPVAYTPDSFGHVAQLPLLVDGFGLKAVVFERGVGDEGERLGTEFRWRAADGRTDVFAVHLVGTYSAATALGHLDWSYQDAYDPERAIRQMRAALFGPDAGEAAFPTWLRDALERLSGGIAGYTRSGRLLLLNGSDHLFPQSNLPEVLDLVGGAIEGVRFVHADVEEYIDAPRPPLDTLEIHQGEFRASRYHHVLSGVWSARMPLKQANHAAETLLERYAEPLLAAALALHAHDDRPLLDHAWRTLLRNHPHDSICGCSVDGVHREMHTRYEAVRQLGEELCRRAVAALTADADERTLVVFEPLPEAGTRVVHAELVLRAGEGERLTLLADDDRPLPIQHTVERRPVPGRSDEDVDHVRVSFTPPTRPLGLTRVRWRVAEPPPAPSGVADAVTATPDGDGWRLENRALRITVDGAGAVTLQDRATGRAQPLSLCLEGQGDAGDAYDFSPVPGDAPRRSGRTTAPPTPLAAGPLRASIAFDLPLAVPERLADDRRTRWGHTVLTARIELALEAYAEHVELTVDLVNGARDHRLRLVVATGVHTDEVASDGHWHVLRRPVRPATGDGWYQAPVPTQHQRRFSAVSDGRCGLAVLVRGLPEVEAVPTEAGVELVVTLLRSVGWLSRDDLLARPQGAGPAVATPEAQCLGAHRFELALCPFDGDLASDRLHRAAERFMAPPRTFVAGPRDPRPDLKPDLATAAADARPRDRAWRVALTPPLTLSALAPARSGGTIVRLWNPATTRAQGRLEIDPAPRAVHRVRLDETRLEPMPHEPGVIELDVGPSEVVTLELTHLEGGDGLS
jgi:mannosylglycerate hydrolase